MNYEQFAMNFDKTNFLSITDNILCNKILMNLLKYHVKCNEINYTGFNYLKIEYKEEIRLVGILVDNNKEIDKITLKIIDRIKCNKCKEIDKIEIESVCSDIIRDDNDNYATVEGFMVIISRNSKIENGIIKDNIVFYIQYPKNVTVKLNHFYNLGE
jgi:phage FluMu protein Com